MHCLLLTKLDTPLCHTAPNRKTWVKKRREGHLLRQDSAEVVVVVVVVEAYKLSEANIRSEASITQGTDRAEHGRASKQAGYPKTAQCQAPREP
jgi:hypothetical protein